MIETQGVLIDEVRKRRHLLGQNEPQRHYGHRVEAVLCDLCVSVVSRLVSSSKTTMWLAAVRCRSRSPIAFSQSGCKCRSWHATVPAFRYPNGVLHSLPPFHPDFDADGMTPTPMANRTRTTDTGANLSFEAKLRHQQAEGARLHAAIGANMKELGYGE